MDLTGLKTIVVGGGIGGVAAAIGLARRGASVTVCEQAAELAEVGAGLQISINGQRALRALGVTGTDAPPQAFVSSGTQMIDGRSGRCVATVPAPSGGPTWYMHRADLLAMLVRAAEDAGVRVELGRVLSPGAVQADLIIAADGVKSVWRNTVDAPVLPSFAGQVAWRALVPWEGRVPPTSAALVMGHRAHIVAYPLRGGRLMNLVAVEDRRDWREEGWMIEGDAAQFRARFADFRGDVQDIVSRVEDVHIWALHARPVAQSWQDGRVALLGDSAHPTLPFMAQGACLALEDAAVLSLELARAATLDAGLRAYQEARRRRAERVVALARGNGWRFHMGWPFSVGANLALRFGAGALARRLEWVYGYDVGQGA